MTPAERSLIGRIGAHERWAHEPDRTTATEPARRGLEARFEREVDPDGILSPAELAKRVRSARSAYYARLQLAAAKARRSRPEGGEAA